MARKSRKLEPSIGPWRNRITRYGEEAPDQLLAHENNWRIHPGTQQAALKAVLQTVGLVQNVIISERSGKCLDGHLRIQMAISEGQQTIPITYVDVTPEEEKLILATIDPLSAMAVADEELLAAMRETMSAEFLEIEKMCQAEMEASVAPTEFTEKGDDISTEHRCPKCGYEWSGKQA